MKVITNTRQDAVSSRYLGHVFSEVGMPTPTSSSKEMANTCGADEATGI